MKHKKELPDDRIKNVIDDIFIEIALAELKHPVWPTDKVHAVGIITEEVGEAMTEANDLEILHKGDIEWLKRELRQVCATAIRALVAIETESKNG